MINHWDIRLSRWRREDKTLQVWENTIWRLSRLWRRSWVLWVKVKVISRPLSDQYKDHLQILNAPLWKVLRRVRSLVNAGEKIAANASSLSTHSFFCCRSLVKNMLHFALYICQKLFCLGFLLSHRIQASLQCNTWGCWHGCYHHILIEGGGILLLLLSHLFWA